MQEKLIALLKTHQEVLRDLMITLGIFSDIRPAAKKFVRQKSNQRRGFHKEAPPT